MNADRRIAAPKSSLLFLVAAALLLITACLVPPWQGRFFNPDSPASPSTWHDGGTFGLSQKFAPLYNPPRAFSNAIFGKVRYPWQPVSAREHVQIDFSTWALVVSIGLVGIGLAARLAAAIESPGRPGPIIQIGFALALSQILSMVLISLYAVVMLFGADDRVAMIIPLACGAIGCLVGLWQAKHTPAHPAT